MQGITFYLLAVLIWTPLALLGVALVLIGNVLVVGRGLGARWRRRIAAT